MLEKEIVQKQLALLNKISAGARELCGVEAAPAMRSIARLHKEEFHSVCESKQEMKFLRATDV